MIISRSSVCIVPPFGGLGGGGRGEGGVGVGANLFHINYLRLI